MRKQHWLIPNILRTEPIDSEFKRLDQFDEDQVMRGHGDLCHLLHYNNGIGDLVSPSYFGMLELGALFEVKRIASDVRKTTTGAAATVHIVNPKTAFNGIGAGQVHRILGKCQYLADAKAYRNAIRLSIRPVVMRSFAEKWIAKYTWERWKHLSNKDLATAIFDPRRPNANAEGRLSAIQNRFGFDSDTWQARYILLRILRTGGRFKSADWIL